MLIFSVTASLIAFFVAKVYRTTIPKRLFLVILSLGLINLIPGLCYILLHDNNIASENLLFMSIPVIAFGAVFLIGFFEKEKITIKHSQEHGRDPSRVWNPGQVEVSLFFRENQYRIFIAIRNKYR